MYVIREHGRPSRQTVTVVAVPESPEKEKPLTNYNYTVMPDALSKTIPIWSAVLNRALFPAETAYHPVDLPPNYLGASEEAQIESRIESFVASLKVCFHYTSIHALN